MFEEMSKPQTDKRGDYDDSEDFYSYYPPVAYNLGTKTHDEAKEDALNMLPSGTLQYTNQIILNGSYIINNHFKLNGQFIYSIIKNFNHTKDISENGVELSVSLTYNLF